mgnify:CR=1 FL=1
MIGSVLFAKQLYSRRSFSKSTSASPSWFIRGCISVRSPSGTSYGLSFFPATNHYLHEQRYRFLLQGLHTVHILLVQRRVINQLTSLRASCLVTIADVLLLHYSKPVLSSKGRKKSGHPMPVLRGMSVGCLWTASTVPQM